MIEMTLAQLRDSLGLTAPIYKLPLKFTGKTHAITGHVCTDSRLLTQGDIFVALPGEQTDGHRFLGDAAKAGAQVAICEKTTEQLLDQGLITEEDMNTMLVLTVVDTRKALGMLAEAHLASLRSEKTGHSKLRTVIGITGSAGKTTTKDLTATLLQHLGNTVWPEKSFNNEVGLPLTVLRAGRDTEFLVLEMGASGVGDLTYLTKIAPLDIAAVLMVGTAHLQAYENTEQLAAAKSEIVTGLSSAGYAVLNLDDERVWAMRKQTKAKIVPFCAKCATVNANEINEQTGQNRKPSLSSVIRAKNIHCDDQSRASFTLQIGSEQANVNLQLLGEHHVSNALAAATIAHLVGMSTETIAKILSQTGPISDHRMRLIALNQDIELLDDSYNANPDSMRAALEVLGKQSGQRRTVAVLGEMLELGENSPQLHERVGRMAARNHIPVIIGVGSLSKYTLQAYQQQAKKEWLEQYPEAKTYYVPTAKEALSKVHKIAAKGDLILLKASNGCGLWKIAQELEEKGSLI